MVQTSRSLSSNYTHKYHGTIIRITLRLALSYLALDMIIAVTSQIYEFELLRAAQHAVCLAVMTCSNHVDLSSKELIVTKIDRPFT